MIRRATTIAEANSSTELFFAHCWLCGKDIKSNPSVFLGVYVHPNKCYPLLQAALKKTTPSKGVTK